MRVGPRNRGTRLASPAIRKCKDQLSPLSQFTRQNGYGFSKASNGSPVVQRRGNVGSYCYPRRAIVTTRQAALSTKATRTTPLQNSRGVCCRKPKSQRHGSRRPRMANRGRRTRLTKVLARMHRHYLCHRCKADGMINSIAIIDRWSTSIPASSFYHILCAVAEADRVLG